MSAVIEIPALTENANGNTAVAGGNFLKLRRISVEEYDLMVEKGVFGEDDQIELLNGAIVEKIPKGTKHATLNDIIATRLFQQLGEKVCVKNQNPIWLDEFSEPEPDIVLAKPPFEKYFDKHPEPNDIFLILEVSDSTLGYDRNTKGLAYARAGIRQYLLLNVQDQTIEDYREPGADGYGAKQTYRIEQSFALVAFPDISFQVKDFLRTEKR